jgi:hypothetical protein
MSGSGGSVSDAPMQKTVDGQPHQLAYITPGEAQTLVNQGGKPTMTNEGIMAYPPLGQAGTSPGTTTSGGSAFSGGGGRNDRDNNREQASVSQYTRARTEAAQVSSDDVYDAPDRDHYRDTQKEIAQKSKGVVDTKMSKEQYEQFNKDLNKYYGTEDVKYEPYGRAGKGTVNLTFKEHYNNVITQNPALKYTPALAFLAAAGRNVGEYLTTDYGTYKYAGPGTDSGGLLGSGERTRVQNDREIMRNLAPDAPYIVSGLDQPDSSPAADFFANMNKNKNELFFQDQYDSAKAKMQGILGSPSPMRYLAVSESPFYNWLKDNSLDKGIL